MAIIFYSMEKLISPLLGVEDQVKALAQAQALETVQNNVKNVIC